MEVPENVRSHSQASKNFKNNNAKGAKDAKVAQFLPLLLSAPLRPLR